jgi:hypothetical protein
MYSSIFLNIGTRWREVVSFTPLPLYSWGKRPRYSLDMGLDDLRVGLHAVDKRKI